MKKLLILTIALAGLLSLGKVQAQATKNKIPSWVPQNGYWVVESNKAVTNQSSIRFYTNNNELVYKEDIEGKKLKLGKRKVKMQLKEVLEKSITQWANNKTATENKDYVKSILH